MKNSAVLLTAAEFSVLVFECVDLHGYTGGQIVALAKLMQLRYRLMYFEAVLDDQGLDK